MPGLRQVLGRLVRGAPRLGTPGRMVAVTGQSPSPDAPQSPSVLEAVLERITYANEDTGGSDWPCLVPARLVTVGREGAVLGT
jgi:hypothetical protein